MDYKKILSFSEYKPIIDENPQFLIDEIIEKFNSYSKEDYSEIIQRTYEFTKSAHEGIYRLSGEPYITHPVQVAAILMELKPDLASIQTAILHDVIEDTEYSYDDIYNLFGEDVANLCEGLVKVKKVKYKGEDTQLETIKKTFLAMAKDLRVILIKIADRIHNMQTLIYHPRIEKQEKIALETMKIYVPVCKRLGLYQYQVLLENLCFKILDPESFKNVFKYFQKYFSMSQKDSEKGIKILTDLLNKEGITDFTVKGRVKSPYRVYEKMIKKYQSWDFNKVMDLLAFRIITNNISDCYSVLGIIHNHYTPLINKIKDYIAIPKFNGYKSIHTTIIGLFRLPIEIQIRTKEMDQIAEYGVAAHFAYSENKRPTVVNKKQSDWILSLQNLVKEYTEREIGSIDKADEFKKKLNMDMLNKSTFLYTPKGDIVEIPRGGTVLDFAFYIHTDVGLRFKHAIVNGTIVPINYIPKTGDIIEIKTFRNKNTATKHWLEFVNSPSSKNKIGRYIRQNERGQLIEKVKITINKHLDKIQLPHLGTKEDLLSQTLGTKKLEGKLLEVWDKKITPTQLIKLCYPEKVKSFYTNSNKNTLLKDKSSLQFTKDVIIDDNKMTNFTFCPECNPQYTNKIIAKVDKHGIKIHTTTCISMKTINFNRLLEAHWVGQEENTYNLRICFKAEPHVNIVEIFTIISGMKMEILTFTINKKNDYNFICLEINSTYPAKLQYMINSLKKFGNSLKLVSKELI